MTTGGAGLTRLATVAFVPLWSSGVLFGVLALRHGPPFAVTGIRFVLAALAMALLATWRRAPWPRGRALWHSAMVGLLLQGGHYAGIYAGLSVGMSAGVAALVVGLIPVATAAGAVPMLGERFTWQRGVAAALGIAATWLVVGSRVGFGPGIAGYWLAALALAGGAGAALWQKRFGGSAGLGAGAVQLVVGAVVMGLCWWLIEREAGARPIEWADFEFQYAFAWLVLMNSVAANLLLMWLLHRGAAGRVTGLFFLVPPFTALTAVPMLGEAPRLPVVIAAVLGAVAVWLLGTERR